MTQQKQDIRAWMRERAAAFVAGGRAAAESARLCAAAETLPFWDASDTLLLYMALDDEVQTAPLLERWYGRKRLVIPRVAGEELELREYRPEALQPGYRGILEPGDDCPVVAPAQIDFALIPGVAFAPASGILPDRIGPVLPGPVARLGRGKGFYDRLLPLLDCPCVGIGYPFRLLSSLPTDPWDRPLDGLLY